MNKKLSLMLAAFVAAGWTFSAKAGVVEVTNPVSGHSYVIADKDWSQSAGTEAFLQSNNAKVQGDAASAYGTLSDVDTDLWKYVENGNGFTLNQGAAFIGLSSYDQSPVMAKDGEPAVFVKDGNKLTVAGQGSLTFSDGTDASWTPAGTEVKFFAYTSQVEATGDVTLKIGNMYVVVADNQGTVKLVDQNGYDSYITLGMDANTLWTVSNGQYVSKLTQSTPVNNVLKVDVSKESGFALAAAGSASTFEVNAEEGLFGTWSTTNVWKYLAIANNKVTEETDLTGKTAASIVAAAPVVASPTAKTTLGSYQLANAVESSEYYLISSNAGNNASTLVLVQESNAKAATMTAISRVTDLETAYWTVSQSYDSAKKLYKFTFTNKKGVTLKVGGISEFYSQTPYSGGVTLGALNSAGTGIDITKSLILKTTPSVELGRATTTPAGSEDNILGFYYVGTANFKVWQLCQYYNTYFDLNLMDKKGGTSDLEGDLFDGGLIPMELVYDKNLRKYVAKEADQYAEVFLLKRKADDAYIVLDWDKKWSVSGIDQHVTAGGYKFDKLSEDNLLAYVNGDAIAELDARHLGFAFSVEYAGYEESDNNKAVKYIKVVDYGKALSQTTDATVSAVSKDNRKPSDAVQYPVYLTTFEADGTTYLTVNADKDDVILYAELQEKTLVHGSDKNNNPLNWKYVNIKFVNHPSVKYWTEDDRQAPLDGKVLGMARDNGANTWEAYPAEANKFLANKPEGQWAVKMAGISDEDAKKGKALDADKNEDVAFTFVNRENPTAQYTVSRMYNLGNNKFAVEYDYRSAFSTAYNAGGIGRDTLEITPVNIESEGARLMDGYKNYTDAEIQDTEYRLIMNSTSNVDYYVSENHAGKHLLGISTNEADAVNWRLVRFDREAIKDVDGYDKYATDSIYVVNHPQYLASDGKYYAYNDTLAIVTYALQNTANGEYLTYEDLQSQDILSMMCDPESENFANHYYNEDTEKETWSYLNGEYRFVIKEKMDGLFNILGVNGGDADRYGYSLNLNNKLYGASTKNTVEVETAYTQINSNDLFRLEAVDAPVYREVAQGDTIRLFREENNAEVLYENGQFLNLGNIDQLKDEMAPALYVDTAYINRGTNTRYQYLLAVNVDRVEPVYDNAGHMLEPDTTYGRFLINHIDSAVWTNENGNIHQNKFINDVEADEPYVKVGFHWGYRTKDQLFLTDKSYQKVEEVINLNSRDFNKAKFAFRYTTPSANDPESSFKIQTRYISYNDAIEGRTEENNNGFLRTVNGVVVVVPGYAKGEEFNLAAEHSTPTANESITAEGAVSVTATDGAVVIKGAEGKNVVIATILGKVVANETVNSDNETIAVPAGIAVVSVDGESFKVVVK